MLDMPLWHAWPTLTLTTTFISLYTRTLLQKLAYDKISAVLSTAVALDTKDVLHHILLVSPQSDHTDYMIAIPTRNIYEKLHNHLHIKTL